MGGDVVLVVTTRFAPDAPGAGPPPPTAASSLARPAAIATQNRHCSSCRHTEGRPSERKFWLVLPAANAAAVSSSQLLRVACCDDRESCAIDLRSPSGCRSVRDICPQL